MRAKKNFKLGPRRKTKTKILKLVLALAVVLILLVVFLVPAFVSSEKGRKIILAKINNSIDGQMDFGSLSVSWWKGIKVTDFSFNDSAGQTLVEVKQIITKPHYGSLLLGSLSFGETIIDEPKVKINLKGQPELRQGLRLDEQVKKAEDYRQEPATGKKLQAITLPIKKINLVVNDGHLKVTDRQAKIVEVVRIDSKLNLRPPGQQTNFDIDMAVVDKGKESKVRAGGRISPGITNTGWSLKGTSGDFTVEVNDLDLGSLGPIFALAGVEVQAKGRIWSRIKSEIKDGRFENLTGTIKGKDLDVAIPQLKGDKLKTSVLDIVVKLHAEEELVNIEKLEVHSDWVDAEASGVVPTTFESLAEFVKADSIYNLKGSFKCDLAAVLSQMPRTFGVREGIKVTSGQLSGDIETFTRAGRREIRGQGSLVGLVGVVGGKTIALAEPVRAEVEITSDKTGINFDKLEVSAAFAKINCTGSSELLRYSADVDLAKLQAELGQFINIGPYQMAGELFSEGEVSGNKEKIIAVGSSEIKNLRLSSIEGISAFEPMADMSFSVAVEPVKNILNVDFIKANASLGQVSVKDAILPLGEKPAKPMRLNVSANKIDLEKLQPFAVLFTSFPKEMQLAGTAESDISISAEKGSYHIVTDATYIKKLKLHYPGQKPFEQEEVLLIFDAEVNPAEKTISVRKLQLVSPQIKIHKGELKQVSKGGKTKLEGRIESEYDWAAVSTVVGPFLPEGLKLKGRRRDTINFFSEYPTGQTEKLLANLNTKAKLGFDKAQYMGLNFGPTEVDIQIQNGLMKIAPFSTTVNNGRFKFEGYADFKRKPVLLKTPGPIQIAKDIQIRDEISRELLVYLIPIFANAANISGVANFHCERLAIPLASATKKDIEVIGTISINKLRLQASDLLSKILSIFGENIKGQEFTVHPTRFVLKDGFTRYDDMQIDVGDNPVNFKGVIGLDKSLDMVITLPYTLDGRTVRVGEEKSGKRIPILLKGTIDKPVIVLPELDVGKLLEEQLRKRLEEELRKGLEELFK